jgi:Glycosyltransferase family 87
VSRLLDLLAGRARFLSLLFTGIGIVFAAYYWYQLTATTALPVDVHAYWVADPNDLYPPAETTIHQDAYLYSPAFEILVGWGRHLTFEAFTSIWRALLLIALVWLAGPFTVFVLFTVPVASEVNAGNIQLLLAASIVLAFRKPAAWAGFWAFVLLTKVTPGVGLLWFAARRQWRHLAVALGVTAAITAVTFAIWPDRWLDWIAMLADGGAPEPRPPYFLPFWPRIAVAVAIVLVGAWRGWRWPVVVAATVALPVFYTISPSLLVGVLPFLREALGRWADRRVASVAGAKFVRT